jgi:filamentous hemagglutinin family protein
MVKSKRRSMRVKPARVVAALAVMAATFNCCAGVGIATDGSAGVHQTIAGANAGAGNFSIPQTLGSLAGNNLFHSFSTFNIDTGQIATFTTTTPAIGNVISRVTGGGLSQINGLLKLTPVSGVPNFFFINPAGVAFGAGGSIDAPGAFHVSTADYVKFANGDKFYADLSKTSVLSSAAPEAFGFLGISRAAIAIRDEVTLTAKPLQPISITSGDIEINNSKVLTHGEDIRVVALGKKRVDIGFTGTLPRVDGNLSVLNGGQISASTDSLINAGTVKVSAGSIAIDGSGRTSGILSRAINNVDNDGQTGNAGSIDITASGVLSIVNGGVISASTYSSGKAGTVMVNAGSITIDGQGSIRPASIASNAVGNADNAGQTGDAGSINITVSGALSIVIGL